MVKGTGTNHIGMDGSLVVDESRVGYHDSSTAVCNEAKLVTRVHSEVVV